MLLPKAVGKNQKTGLWKLQYATTDRKLSVPASILLSINVSIISHLFAKSHPLDSSSDHFKRRQASRCGKNHIHWLKAQILSLNAWITPSDAIHCHLLRTQNEAFVQWTLIFASLKSNCSRSMCNRLPMFTDFYGLIHEWTAHFYWYYLNEQHHIVVV